jgi:hypothetical protein
MHNDTSQTLVSLLMELGAIPGAALLFSVFCTAWLIGVRIRGYFRFRQPTPLRDFAFLIASPVSAILISVIQAAAGAAAMFTPDFLDADFYLAANLKSTVGVCLVAIACFVAGLVSIALPAKSDANVA